MVKYLVWLDLDSFYLKNLIISQKNIHILRDNIMVSMLVLKLKHEKQVMAFEHFITRPPSQDILYKFEGINIEKKKTSFAHFNLAFLSKKKIDINGKRQVSSFCNSKSPKTSVNMVVMCNII